jgi:hypothetical protein
MISLQLFFLRSGGSGVAGQIAWRRTFFCTCILQAAIDFAVAALSTNPASHPAAHMQLFLRCNLLDFAVLRMRSCNAWCGMEWNALRSSAWQALRLCLTFSRLAFFFK